MSHNLCPICFDHWVPADALRHHSDASPVMHAPIAESMCPPCEVAFERALWVAFDTTTTRADTYREAERVTVITRRSPALADA